MATAILGPQDYFQGRFRGETLTLAPSIKPRMRNPNTDSSGSRPRKPRPVAVQSNPHNRSHSRSMMVATFPSKNLAMGEVKILKRGESFGRTGNRVSSGNRKPRMSNLKIESHAVERIYAGSAFATSPPPSSLPIPGFLGKKSNGMATSDLRRLLKLDVV